MRAMQGAMVNVYRDPTMFFFGFPEPERRDQETVVPVFRE
jgi:hypothetical protein